MIEVQIIVQTSHEDYSQQIFDTIYDALDYLEDLKEKFEIIQNPEP